MTRRFQRRFAILAAITCGACYQWGCIQAIAASIGATFF